MSDCAQTGHVWLEPNGQLYRRHKGRTGTVHGKCRNCGAEADLDVSGAFTRGGPASPKIGMRIPPQFKRVVDMALDNAGPNPGPASADSHQA